MDYKIIDCISKNTPLTMNGCVCVTFETLFWQLCYSWRHFLVDIMDCFMDAATHVSQSQVIYVKFETN